MSFEFYKESYAGAIKAISIGKGDKAITVGGETCYPLYQFEGEMPHKPKVAMEIWDMAPDEWPAAAMEPFKDVVSDPAAWAKKCVEEYGAEIIVLQLKSTDPNGTDASPADASVTVKKVLAATGMTLDDIDMIELNEAFASQAIGCMRELGIEADRPNELGSGISIGHPIGCTGARQMVSGMNQMKRKGYSTGLITMCIGGGMGMAMIVER